MRWALLALLAGCAARPRPVYVPVDLPLPERPASREQVVGTVRWAMERGRIPRLGWSPALGLPERELTVDELDEVPVELLWTAWVCSPRRLRGGELDLLLPGDPHALPLTVWLDLDGGVHLLQGARPPAPAAALPADEAGRLALARRHGLGGIVDGERPWAPEELALVDQALGLLDPRERALLAGLVLSRDGASPRDVRELALYDPVAEPRVIHVYDGAFAAGSWSFVGPLDQPIPAPVMTLVHEFGHALADAPLAAAWDRLLARYELHRAATPEERPLTRAGVRMARRDLRAVGRRGPVVRAFAELRPGRRWPTTWSTDVFEAFAEAFALYHTDPDALLRVAPEAHAWFTAGAHLAGGDPPG